MKSRVCVSVLLLHGILLAAPLAQQRPPAPTFRSTTQYVAVDVIVTDSQDRIVRDLTKTDFTVTEAGVRQTIDDFSFVEVPLAARTVDSIAPPRRRPTSDPIPASREPAGPWHS